MVSYPLWTLVPNYYEEDNPFSIEFIQITCPHCQSFRVVTFRSLQSLRGYQCKGCFAVAHMNEPNEVVTWTEPMETT